jgi:heat shock protein HtpX
MMRVFMYPPRVGIPRRPSMALFAIFAIVIVIASYLFVLLLAAACVYLPYLLLSTSGSPGLQTLVLFLFGVVIAGAMLWSLIPRRDKFEAPGLLLDRSIHPRLFAELDTIAAALNEKLPREVYLIGDANAFVADRGGIVGFGSRRVLGIGLPLLTILTVSQFRAVLAHEFGHYYGGDTSLGPWVYKTKSSIIRIFENIGSVRQLARIAILGLMYVVVTTLLKWYFIGFLRAINFVSRRQEYRADELACLIAGRQNLIAGLQAIHGTVIGWPSYWKSEIAPLLSDGKLVAICDGFSRFMGQPQISVAVGRSLAERLEKEKTEPYDTHPPLRERIAAAERLAEDSVPEDPRPAISLLDNLEASETSFVEQCVPDIVAGSLQYIRWDEVAARVTIPSWQNFVGEYADDLRGVTAGTIPGQVANFRHIGSHIRDPKGILLSPEQRTFRAGGLFAGALALAMVRAGWELEVQPNVFRMRRDGREFDPFGAVNQLMAGKLSADQWSARCNELGLSKLSLSPNGHTARSEENQSELFAVQAETPPR